MTILGLCNIEWLIFYSDKRIHSTTGKTPGELYLKREPRMFLSLVKPSLKRRVESCQAASKLYTDGGHPKLRTFDLHQPVRVRNVRGEKEKWIQGTIAAIKGPETYFVRVPGNNLRFVHANPFIPDGAREQNTKKQRKGNCRVISHSFVTRDSCNALSRNIQPI